MRLIIFYFLIITTTANYAQTFKGLVEYGYSMENENDDTIRVANFEQSRSKTIYGKSALNINVTPAENGISICNYNLQSFFHITNDSVLVYQDSTWQLLANTAWTIGDSTSLILSAEINGIIERDTFNIKCDRTKKVKIDTIELNTIYLKSSSTDINRYFSFVDGWYNKLVGHYISFFPWRKFKCDSADYKINRIKSLWDSNMDISMDGTKFLKKYLKSELAYTPFSMEKNTQWENYESVFYGATNTNWCQTTTYTIKDTVHINDLVYHKVFGSEKFNSVTTSQICTLNTAIPKEFYFGAIRNDTANKRVYLIKDSSSVESLFYDFNHSIGDYVVKSETNKSTNSYMNTLVDSIGYLSFGDKNYKTYFYNGHCNNYPRARLIEGIGHEYGFNLDMIKLCGAGYGSELRCFGTKGSSIYPDTSWNCGVISSINELLIADAAGLSVYPNPTKDILKILFQDENISKQVQLFDLVGREYRVQLIKESALQYSINVEGLGRGVYLLQMKLSNGMLVTKKVIKK